MSCRRSAGRRRRRNNRSATGRVPGDVRDTAHAADDRGHGIRVGGATVDRGQATAGPDAGPALVPDRFSPTAGRPFPVQRVAGTGVQERFVLCRVPGPAGLDLRVTHRSDVRRYVRVADLRCGATGGGTVRAHHPGRSGVTRGGEKRVVLGQPTFEGCIELCELCRRGGLRAERLLVGTKGHREDGPRRVLRNGPVDGLHEVGQTLHALRLGGRGGRRRAAQGRPAHRYLSK